nr:DUF6686 family protein [uncultured Marinifilum sp.]
MHLEFNNININFSNESKYHQFADYVHALNGEEIEKENVNAPYYRKILIQIGGGACNFILHKGELEDLKRLCIRRLNKKSRNFTKLEIDFSLN